MAKEINVVFEDVQQAIESVRTAIGGVEVARTAPDKGKNELSSLNELEQAAVDFTEAMSSYQAVLQDHLQKTEQAVESVREQDEAVAGGIRGGGAR